MHKVKVCKASAIQNESLKTFVFIAEPPPNLHKVKVCKASAIQNEKLKTFVFIAEPPPNLYKVKVCKASAIRINTKGKNLKLSFLLPSRRQTCAK